MQLNDCIELLIMVYGFYVYSCVLKRNSMLGAYSYIWIDIIFVTEKTFILLIIKFRKYVLCSMFDLFFVWTMHIASFTTSN